MILIYTHTSTKRLQYICKFIFKEQLGVHYTLTIDEDGFTNHDGPKINYSTVATGAGFTISPHELLFEKTVTPQDNTCFIHNGYKALFQTKGGDYEFDILAAIFYLISRYEEYLPHEKDSHGRYAHQNSLAFKEDFLNIPLVNIWLQDFLKKLTAAFPALRFQLPAFKLLPTYDIDIAWSYKNKGLLRNLGGFLKKPSFERISVLTGLKQDPFNCYEFLHALHKDRQLEPLYFFLVATSTNNLDKNISPFSGAMAELIRQHAKKYDIGLHPSSKSYNNAALIKKERKILENASHVHVTKSRQHYIKFNLPETMEKLLESGILHEYSMGYGSINGFRASVASSFHWFDLKNDNSTRLKIHPFCFMDANSFYEQHLNAEEAYKELIHYYEQCERVNGTMITIFHNSFLGTDKQFERWRQMYSHFISQVPK